MTAKEYLKQIKSYALVIKAKEFQLKELRSGQVYMDAIRYDKERVQSSGSLESKYMLQSEKLVTLEQEIQKLIEEYLLQKNYIIDQINSLEDVMAKEILYKRYVEYMRIEDIADDMGYHPTYISNCHLEALKLFEETYLSS